MSDTPNAPREQTTPPAGPAPNVTPVMPPAPGAAYAHSGGYAQQPAHPSYTGHQGWGPRRTGAVAWAMGFLVFLPLPFVSVIVTAIVTVAVGLAQRKHGGIAAQNGSQAANWALSVALVDIVALGIGVTCGVISSTTGEDWLMWVFGVTLLLAIGLGIAHFVVTIVGIVKANRGETLRPYSITFFRP